MKTEFSIKLRQTIRAKYAWPGGYPMFLVMADGEALCMDCARKEYKLIARATRDNRVLALRDQWLAVGAEVNWEDTTLTCCHCNTQIESAYGEQ